MTEVFEMADGSTAMGHVIALGIGRMPVVTGLGLETVGVEAKEGELAAKAALGDDVTVDLRAVPRCVYTDPELAAVGLRVEQACDQGIDAVELTQDLATTAKGYLSEAKGHVTIVVDRAARTLVGAFIAGPGATEAIHEAVLALKLRVPLAVLEDTIHAFPTTSRVFGTVVARASRELAGLTPLRP